MPRIVKPEREPALTVLHCRRCGAVLGVSSGAALTIGAAVVAAVVTVHCVKCGHARKWRPSVN